MRWRTWRTGVLVLVIGLGVHVLPGRSRVEAQSPLLQALDATQPITYYIADGKAETGFRPADRQLALWAFGAWQKNAGGRFVLAPAEEPLARIRLYWAGPSDGQYGEMRPLIVDGQRGAAVYIRPDMSALGPDIAARAADDVLVRDSIVYLTCLHELGHAFGLSHTGDFRDIMFYFGYGGDLVEYFGRYRRQLGTRTDIGGASGLSLEDVRRLQELYPQK